MKTNRHKRQKGAALVVGLMLLVIVTVLAVSAVGTASTEMIMAGNEQYRERAFQAAEIGIENGIRKLSTVPQDRVVHTDPVVNITSLPQDSYVLSTVYIGDDNDIPMFSSGKFVGLSYRMNVTGSSQRNSTSTHEQGAFVLGASGSNPPIPPDNTLGRLDQP